MAKCQVTHEEEALLDLAEQHAYISNHSPAAADKYIAGLLTTVEHAAEFPEAGRTERWIARELGADYRKVRSLLYRNHRCYYFIRSDSEIYTCLHSWREAKKQSIARAYCSLLGYQVRGFKNFNATPNQYSL